jgi:hypothetical protein
MFGSREKELELEVESQVGDEADLRLRQQKQELERLSYPEVRARHKRAVHERKVAGLWDLLNRQRWHVIETEIACGTKKRWRRRW